MEEQEKKTNEDTTFCLKKSLLKKAGKYKGNYGCVTMSDVLEYLIKFEQENNPTPLVKIEE